MINFNNKNTYGFGVIITTILIINVELLMRISPVASIPIETSSADGLSIILNKFNCTLNIIETSLPPSATRSYSSSTSSSSSSSINSNKIKQIHLENCSGITELPAGIFRNLSNDENTDLIISNSENLIKINNQALNSLRMLRSISITNTKLTGLSGRWSDHYFNMLDSLNFDNNQISFIHVNSLQTYPNVRNLSCHNNQITNIPLGLFINSTILNNIDFSDNKINTLSDSNFDGLTQLTTLLLNDNQLSVLNDRSFNTLIQLKHLRLDGNLIRTINGKLFRPLSELIVLNISNNRIEQIESGSFENNGHLKVIDLSFNRLIQFSKFWAVGLNSIEVLNISHNSISNVGPMLSEHLTNLKQLDLSFNLIKSISDTTFRNLKSLTQLDGSSNQINNIHNEAFNNQNKLNVLKLQKNDLTTEEFLHTIKSLRYLNMSYNKFVTLNMSLFFHFHNVDVIGNPWSCTWLIEEMMSASDGVHFGKNYTDTVHHMTVPGIDCLDELGKLRSIVVLHVPAKLQNEYTGDGDNDQTNSELTSLIKPHPNQMWADKAEQDQQITQDINKNKQNKAIRKILDKEFDYKTCILWITVAVVAVYGTVHLGKMFFRRSEMNSEKFRLSQQVCLLTTMENRQSKKVITSSGGGGSGGNNTMGDRPSSELETTRMTEITEKYNNDKKELDSR